MQVDVYEKYEDIKEVRQVILLIQKQMEVIKSSKSESDIDQSIKNALMENKRASLFVCYEKGEPIGFIFGNICSGIESGKDYFWINEIHVKEEYRRKRVASLMIKCLEGWVKGKDIEYVAAMTSTENEKSKRFFKSLEFGVEDVVWIDKRIN